MEVDDLSPKHWADELSQLHSRVERLLIKFDDDSVRRRPGAEELSAIEIAGHLSDKMTVWRARLLRVLSSESPMLGAYDRERIGIEQGYLGMKTAAVLVDLNSACQSFASVVREVEPASLQRVGIHPVGPITAEDCIRIPIVSARAHLEQIRALLRQTIDASRRQLPESDIKGQLRASGDRWAAGRKDRRNGDEITGRGLA